MEIRKAQHFDYPAICSLINNELGYKSVKLNELSSRIKAMNQDKNYYTFVAVADDAVVGFIGLMKNMTYEFNGLCMRVLSIAVAEGHQGAGIGKSLLRYAEEFAVSKGIDLFMVNSGTDLADAHRFYEKNGFKKSSYGFWKIISDVSYVEHDRT